ncbi:MAG: S8 family serine peptidase [Planctomycetaceae bacterium]|nr:S8 family serine peptidase [Planctomycetaceae bacterium]
MRSKFDFGGISVQGVKRSARRGGWRFPTKGIEELEIRTLLSASGVLYPQPAEMQGSAMLQQEEYAQLIGTSFHGGDFTTQDAESGPLISLDDFRNDARFTAFDGSGYATVIIDTGIDLNHPFFGPDLDNNGVSDRIVYSYDFSGTDDPDASDFDGHGSNVASIVASSDTTHPGMAPGADIIALKVFPDEGGGASFQDIAQALQWVADNAAAYNIVSVNMSLGLGNFTTVTTGQLSTVMASVAAQGVIIVSASGNDFFDIGSQQGVAYPSADPNSLSVGAVYDANIGPVSYGGGATAFSTAADRITPFSQRSGTLTTVFAPGAAITGASANGGLLVQHGTSQASPHISGIAVLAQQMADQYRGERLTQSEFATLLNTTGDSIIDGDDENDNVTNTGLTFRRVNVFSLAEELFVDSVVKIGDTVGVARQSYFLLDANQNHNWDSTTGGDLEGKFGNNNDLPIAGDWDGDGIDEIGVFRDGTWFLDYNGNGLWDGTGGGDKKYKFGTKNDRPVVGDWDGNGFDDIGVFRKGEWYLDLNGNGFWDKVIGGDAYTTFGNKTDVPVAGDWNGDGDADIGVFRDGTWYLDLNGNRLWNGPIQGDAISKFGTAGDIPIAGDWNQSGKDKLGVYRSGTVFLDVDGSRHWNLTDEHGDVSYRFGNPTDLPIVGTWKLIPAAALVPSVTGSSSSTTDGTEGFTFGGTPTGDTNETSGGPSEKILSEELDVSYGSSRRQRRKEGKASAESSVQETKFKGKGRDEKVVNDTSISLASEFDTVFSNWS